MTYATYCPEDNKLRLYVGRVPRAEYEALRADGWTSTPKQDCDFVAVWTPQRRATAAGYCEDGQIEDEDQGPEDRAADRAERFSGYLEKRTDEATGHADRYDSEPSAHGFQNYGKAVKAADRHDRHADRATDAWSKAEYWQRRTAGVISHALHVCSPSVRMGRIKTLEAELRGLLSRWNCPEEEITSAPAREWISHTKLRLAYENQMIEAQGGRAASIEIEVGGFLGGRQIYKVNKSPATGRVTSVSVKGPKVQSWTYKAANVPGTDYALYQFDTERLAPGAYRAPTEEEKAAFSAAMKDEKKARAAVVPKAPPLINPTDDDAERLQAIWNEAAEKCGWYKRNGGTPSTVLRTTQANYSAASGGYYSHTETVMLCEHGTKPITRGGKCYSRFNLCKVRATSNGYNADRVIVITDKPQKPLPWAAIADALAKCPTVESMTPSLPALRAIMANDGGRKAEGPAAATLSDAVYIGWITHDCYTPQWTEKGFAALTAYDAEHSAPAFSLT